MVISQMQPQSTQGTSTNRKTSVPPGNTKQGREGQESWRHQGETPSGQWMDEEMELVGRSQRPHHSV